MKRQWSRGRKLSLLGDSSTLGATDEMRGFLLRRFQEFLEAKLVLSIWWAISWRSKYGYEGLVAACSLGWLGSTCRGKASFRLSRAGPFYSEELFVYLEKNSILELGMPLNMFWDLRPNCGASCKLCRQTAARMSSSSSLGGKLSPMVIELCHLSRLPLAEMDQRSDGRLSNKQSVSLQRCCTLLLHILGDLLNGMIRLSLNSRKCCIIRLV